MRLDARVDASAHDDVMVLTLSGEFDISNVGELEKQVLAQVADETVGLVLDLSEVRYIDSAGVRVLFKVADLAAASRRGISLVVPEDSPLRTLVRITHLDEVAAVQPSLAEGVGAARGGAGDRV